MANPTPITYLGPGDQVNSTESWKCDFLEVQVRSNVGRKRKNNEDSFVLCAPEAPDYQERRGFLFAVADGMGGASAGEHASRLTLLRLAERYYSPKLKGFTPSALKESIETANDAVYAEAQANPEYEGMGTTVSAVALMGNWGYLAQVGDSRIYLLRSEIGLRQVTEDHSLVAEQVRNGLLNEDEARNHLLKNLITRAVGIKENVDVDLFALELKTGDTMLLCSDGLSNMVPDTQLQTILQEKDLTAAADMLLDSALEAGGTDNITFILLRVAAAPPETYYQQGAHKIALTPEGFLQRMKRWFS